MRSSIVYIVVHQTVAAAILVIVSRELLKNFGTFSPGMLAHRKGNGHLLAHALVHLRQQYEL